MRFLSIGKENNKSNLQFEARFDAGLVTFDDADIDEGVICARYHTDSFPIEYKHIGDYIDLFVTLGNDDAYYIGVLYKNDSEMQEFIVELNECEKIKLLIHLIKHLMK